MDLFIFSLTRTNTSIDHGRRWDEAKSGRLTYIKPAQQKKEFLIKCVIIMCPDRNTKTMKLLNQFAGVWFLIFLEALAAQSQNLLTLQPIFTEADAVIEDQFEGCRRYDFLGMGIVSIQRIGDNFYHLNISDQSASSQFEAVLTRVGNLLLLDIVPLIPDIILNLDLAQNLLKAHTFFRVTKEAEPYGWWDIFRLSRITLERLSAI